VIIATDGDTGGFWGVLVVNMWLFFDLKVSEEGDPEGGDSMAME